MDLVYWYLLYHSYSDKETIPHITLCHQQRNYSKLRWMTHYDERNIIPLKWRRDNLEKGQHCSWNNGIERVRWGLLTVFKLIGSSSLYQLVLVLRKKIEIDLQLVYDLSILIIFITLSINTLFVVILLHSYITLCINN